MAGLDDLFAQIPVADIANKLGAPEAEVNTAIHQLVPALVGGLQVNAQNDDGVAGKIANSAEKHAGLLGAGGVAVDDVDENDGDKIVANIFGGNNSDQVASALAGGGAAGAGDDLIKRLLPILAPIVLAYIGKQFGGQAAQSESSGGGGIADVLGSILGGSSGGGGNNPLGSILGSVLGGGSGGSNPIGDILGGLLGGKR